MKNLNNESIAQRKRLIEALRKAKSKGLSTIQIRENLDVMEVGSRICELRWQHGFNIQTVKRTDTNAQGNEHECAYYVLLPGKWKGTKKKKAV